MTHAGDLARQLVTLHCGERPDLKCFDEPNRVVFELRHLPLSIAVALEEPSKLSDLPADQAQLLFELVRVAGSRYTSTSIFIDISNALSRPGPSS